MACTSSANAEIAAPAPSARMSRRVRATRWIIARWCTPIEFTGEFAKPAKLHLELLNGQADHPDRLMEAMSHFFSNRAQRGLLQSQFLLKERLPASNLPRKHRRPRLPGERDPGEKRRPLALRSPFLALQCIGERRAPLGCSRKGASFGADYRLLALGRSDQSEPRQFLERIVHLRPRNAGPMANLAAFQLLIRFVAVHGSLGQETQQDQIRRGQFTRLGDGHHAPFGAGSSTTTGIVRRVDPDRPPAPPPPRTPPDRTSVASARRRRTNR